MKVGDVIKLPCGAAVEIKYLAPPDDRGDKGLVAVRVKSQTGLFFLENLGTRVLCNPVGEIELNFYPENIPVLVAALGEMAKQLLTPASKECQHCGRTIVPCSMPESCPWLGWVHVDVPHQSPHFCNGNYGRTACPKQS